MQSILIGGIDGSRKTTISGALPDSVFLHISRAHLIDWKIKGRSRDFLRSEIFARLETTQK